MNQKIGLTVWYWILPSCVITFSRKDTLADFFEPAKWQTVYFAFMHKLALFSFRETKTDSQFLDNQEPSANSSNFIFSNRMEMQRWETKTKCGKEFLNLKQTAISPDFVLVVVVITYFLSQWKLWNGFNNSFALLPFSSSHFVIMIMLLSEFEHRQNECECK